MSSSSFSSSAKFLHWSVAALIVTQFVLAELAEVAEHRADAIDQLALWANHKSVGMTILLLAIIRVGVRITSAPPKLPNTMPDWQKTASHLSHILLYSFLFALPLTGWLMSSATAYSVSWFNLFAFPDLVTPSEELAGRLQSTHHFLAKALVGIAGLHILAALKHHFVDKDDVLKRMTGISSWLLFITLAVLAVASLGRFTTANVQTNVALEAVTGSNTDFQLSDLSIWNIDYQDSYIRFSGDQAGAPFEGEWQSWKAKIQFDQDNLADSRFDVAIEVETVFSNDKERDDTIRSAEFFDVSQFAQASFRAQQFEQTESGFLATGQLTMKGLSSEASLNFKIDRLGEQLILSGNSLIDRLSWNIGTGDWADTSWVGQQVSIDVRVVANTENE